MDDILKVLNSKFVYTPDTTESWNYLDLTKDVVHGDCEDYVLTLQRELGGDIYFCKVSGWGHAVLYLDGKWIDCNTKRWVTKFPDNYTRFSKYYWPQVKLKLLIGWVKRLFKGG